MVRAPLSRRGLLAAAVAAPAVARADGSTDARLRTLETRLGGRIGLSALDTETGRSLAYRGGERFAMCSTFKLALAAAILSRVERNRLSLQQKIAFGEKDLLGHAPVARARVTEGGLSIEALCAAAVEDSDNTAANLLLDLVGGPAGFTAWLRGLGDRTTRLDRNELSLNTNLAGDPRDTTTPAAMSRTMRGLLVGEALSAASRSRLTGWMVTANRGLGRLRAGMPPGWRAGNKAGTGGNGALNDLAIAWPPGRRPILIAAYSTGSAAPEAEREAALAAVGRIVAERFA